MVNEYNPQAHGGDGHRKGYDPNKTSLPSISSVHPMPNPLDKFTNPGEKVAELMMRTIFPDTKTANIACLGLSYVREFGMSKEFTDEILEWLASRCSIGGIARNQLLQAYTGVVSEKMNTTWGLGGRFFGKNRQNGQAINQPQVPYQ